MPDSLAKSDVVPDREQIRIFLDVVFSYCDGLIPVRNLREKGQSALGPTATCWIEAGPRSHSLIADIAIAAAITRTALYVIPGTVAELGQASAHHVRHMQSLVIDIDEGDIPTKLAHLIRFLGHPTLLVQSGGITEGGAEKLHAWWKLTEAVSGHDIAHVCDLRKLIAEKVGADGSFASAHQPIRVAGSVYHKYGARRLVRIREQTSYEYDLGEFAEAAADMPALPGYGKEVKSNVEVGRPSQDGTGVEPTGNLQVTAPLSVEGLLRNIRAGNRWHDNMLRLTGHWIARGWVDEEIITASEALTLPGYTVEDTRREVRTMIDGGRRKWNISEPARTIPKYVGHSLVADFLDSLDVASLPRRRWLMGRSLIRGHVTLAIAPPGVGKSTRSVQQAVALVTGRELTGEAVHEAVKAWLYNVEDDKDELRRRLAAVLQHWSIPFEEVRGRLALNSGADRPLLLARPDRKGSILREPDVDACIDEIRKNDIGVFIVDPFAEVHEVGENLNDQIKVVAAMFREIARAGNCAVQLVHHTAKPAPGTHGDLAGNMNAARGASALTGVARVVQTIAPMSNSEAKAFDVQNEDRHRYMRVDDAKANLGPLSAAAKWFRRVSVMLANGDDVGVLEPWDFAATRATKDVDAHTAILQDIHQRWIEHHPYSAAPQSARYVGKMMKTQFGLSKWACRELIDSWLDNGVLVVEVLDKRSKQKGLRVLKWPK